MEIIANILLFILSVILGSALGHKRLAVRPGENVTLSCENISKDETQVDWFRVENGTKANCISSILGANPPSYCAGFKNGRFRMSSNKTDVFLKIDEVDFLDTGLYFCGNFLRSNIVLGETTYLNVNSDEERLAPGTHVEEHVQTQTATVILGALAAFSCVVITGLSVKIVHLQRVLGASKRNASEPRESSAAGVYRPTAVRGRTSKTSEETHVVYTFIR